MSRRPTCLELWASAVAKRPPRRACLPLRHPHFGHALQRTMQGPRGREMATHIHMPLVKGHRQQRSKTTTWAQAGRSVPQWEEGISAAQISIGNIRCPLRFIRYHPRKILAACLHRAPPIRGISSYQSGQLAHARNSLSSVHHSVHELHTHPHQGRLTTARPSPTGHKHRHRKRGRSCAAEHCPRGPTLPRTPMGGASRASRIPGGTKKESALRCCLSHRSLKNEGRCTMEIS